MNANSLNYTGQSPNNGNNLRGMKQVRPKTFPQAIFADQDARFTDSKAKEWCISSHPRLSSTLLNATSCSSGHTSKQKSQKCSFGNFYNTPLMNFKQSSNSNSDATQSIPINILFQNGKKE